MSLSRFLALEQRAFLGRSRRTWGNHLKFARAFLGEALERADLGRPVLILGAGGGLEIPWSKAPKQTVGWDGDPWSRLRTAFRHRRLPDWVFQDFTGSFAELEAVSHRAHHLPGLGPGLGHRREPWMAAERLAALLPSLHPQPTALEEWLHTHRPGTILLANVLGQIGCMAQRIIEQGFGDFDPWDDEHPVSIRLMENLDAWTVRVLKAVLGLLEQSGAEIWMIHDRAVIWNDPAVSLGPFCENWREQLVTAETLEISDPLCGEEPSRFFASRIPLKRDHWLWFLAQGQLHMMEALAYSANGSQGQLKPLS